MHHCHHRTRLTTLHHRYKARFCESSVVRHNFRFIAVRNYWDLELWLKVDRKWGNVELKDRPPLEMHWEKNGYVSRDYLRIVIFINLNLIINLIFIFLVGTYSCWGKADLFIACVINRHNKKNLLLHRKIHVKDLHSSNNRDKIQFIVAKEFTSLFRHNFLKWWTRQSVYYHIVMF